MGYTLVTPEYFLGRYTVVTPYLRLRVAPWLHPTYTLLAPSSCTMVTPDLHVELSDYTLILTPYLLWALVSKFFCVKGEFIH
jgi:hypothetical protein